MGLFQSWKYNRKKSKREECLALIEEAENSEKKMDLLYKAQKLDPAGRYVYAKALSKKDWRQYSEYVQECMRNEKAGRYVLASRLAMDGGNAMSSKSSAKPGKPDLHFAWKCARQAADCYEPQSQEQLQAVKDAVTEMLDQQFEPLIQLCDTLKDRVPELFEKQEYDKIVKPLSPYRQLLAKEDPRYSNWMFRVQYQPKKDLDWAKNAYAAASLLQAEKLSFEFIENTWPFSKILFDQCSDDGTFYSRYARIIVWCRKNDTRKHLELDHIPWINSVLNEGIQKGMPQAKFWRNVVHIYRTGDSGPADSPVMENHPQTSDKNDVWISESRQRNADMLLGGTGKTLEEKMVSGEMSYSDYLDYEELNKKKK